ncbi:RNase adapter RapZ [Metallumcola ferriviriculae]|uniref:RNase adapter RapZ n=1 Tax=Metallumcola ferriviriculae TaxID=3039180 RepID=A0AAU0UL66_9FIRM|nr:RNase adapter RapZ [Desulfitibacteraceae bacterium MK1]
MQLVIVTGLSGAGKTQAVRALEDLGYFCVDNMPPNLISRFAELFRENEGEIQKVALVMDIRGGKFFESVFEALTFLDAHNHNYEILFLEASEEVLVKRFKETRRRHPLSTQGRILDGIIEERKRLQDLRGRASKVIDTSDLNVHQLKEQVVDLYGDSKDNRMVVTLMSFGFKYGIPLDADLVMDVRFLPNPHYEPHLRNFTGHDQKVQEYVLESPVTRIFLEKFEGMLAFLLPYYVQEGKSHLVIAIGCTGGRHRSVTLANEIGGRLDCKEECRISVKHRDIMRNSGEQA